MTFVTLLPWRLELGTVFCEPSMSVVILDDLR